MLNANDGAGTESDSAIHVHLDCPSGLAGDMFLAACVDAGVPVEPIREVPRRLGLETVEVRFFEDRRGGLRGLRCEVLDGDELAEFAPHASDAASPDQAHPHEHSHGSRDLSDIRRRIEDSGLAPEVRERALSMFARLAEVEASVHGIPLDRVHFHEVGAVDSLVDIVGAALAWSLLDATTASVSDVVVGSGRVRTAHGVMPVPAPATAALLRGKRCVWEGQGELLTPTGALILENMFPGWAVGADARPALGAIDRIGVGLGRRDLDDRCNGCRISVSNAAASGPGGSGSAEMTWETITVVETQVDDVSPEQVAHALAAIRALPTTLDAFSQAVLMKKGRPGTLITVHCEDGSAAPTVTVLARETGTLGCRVEQSRRWVAAREVIEVETRYGRIRVKVGRLGSEVISAAPEAEDCRAAAESHRTSWRRVYDAAHGAALDAIHSESRADQNQE